jgi:ppGpp synthetase/RelA/SpoT-type nucleotidyltranferase
VRERHGRMLLRLAMNYIAAPIDEPIFSSEYATLVPKLKKFQCALIRKMRHLFTAYETPILCIESRIKSFDETLKKCRKEGFHNLSEVKDLVGIRVIVNYADEIRGIASILKISFQAEVRRNITAQENGQLDRFNYDALHIQVSPYPTDKALAKHCDLSAEVQVRTVLEHAWCVKNHEMYKDENLCPEVQREMYGYRAQIENMDKALIRLRDRYNELKNLDGVFATNAFETRHLSLESLKKYICERVDLSMWMEIGRKAGMTSMSYEYEQKYGRKELDAYNEFLLESLLESLYSLGVCTLEKFKQFLETLEADAVKELPNLIAYARKHFGGTPIADPIDILISLTEKRRRPEGESKWYGGSIGGGIGAPWLNER